MQGAMATVDLGDRTLREVNVYQVDTSVGEFIVVHARSSIEVLDGDEAEKTLAFGGEVFRRDAAV